MSEPCVETSEPWDTVAAVLTGLYRPGRRRLHELAQLSLQIVDLVAQTGGGLEPGVGGRVLHLLLEAPDEASQLVVRQLGEIRAGAIAHPRAPVTASGRGGPRGGKRWAHVGDGA